MTLPTVAVVVPTHNRWPTVGRAVASVLAQSYPATQCVVVDDASTDETPRLLRQRFGHRVSVLELAQNLEKSAARNAGIRAARADYVCLLDSDDELTPHSVEDRVAIFRREPSFAGVSYGLACRAGSESGTRWVGRPCAEGDVLLQYIRQPFLHNNGFMLSRQNMESHGMYDPRLTHREDKELLIRLAARFEFRFCGAFVNRNHFTAGSARHSYEKAAAQGLLMLDCLRANSLVRERLGDHFYEIERAECWELLRDLYKAGRYSDYRGACAGSWRRFAGCGKMQRRIVRRWISSFVLQLFTFGKPDGAPGRLDAGDRAGRR